MRVYGVGGISVWWTVRRGERDGRELVGWLAREGDECVGVWRLCVGIG